MTKDEFLKQLKKNLKYLKKKEQQIYLESYQNLENYNLDPAEIANQIYIDNNLPYRITYNIKLRDAILIITDKIKEKNIRKNIIFFFLKLFLLSIVIEIPFLYVREMISTMFNETFIIEQNYFILKLVIELIYAITTIIMIISLLKKKAYELKKTN